MVARMTADVFDPPPAASAPRFSLPSPKIMLLGGIGLAALVVGAVALPHLFGGKGAKPPAASAVAPARRPARAVKPAPSAAPATAPLIKPDSPEAAKSVASALQTGRARMASGDFGGAVLAFNQALALDPANAEAKAGFDEAGQRYKASKAEQDAINTIKLAFRDGEFTSGLRLAYRLPPSVSKSYTDGIKVAGWYNLAIVAMRAGDCKGALSQLDEALDVAPADAEAKSLRELASRYADAVKDRAFLDRVEALAFRPLPES
jgi:tetratricopeptide (TPR) repeat protein